MKKIVYTFLIAFASALLFTSCQEEEVAPRTENNTGSELYLDQVKK